MRIGSGCRIYITQWGTEPFLISIGDRVTVTSGVRFLTHDGSTWLVREKGERYQRYGRISIGNDVFIGINSIILPGVSIGSRVVIGAGSVVTRNVPQGTVWAGVPAKQICTFDSFEERVRSTCANESELAALSYEEKIMRSLSIQDERR